MAATNNGMPHPAPPPPPSGEFLDHLVPCYTENGRQYHDFRRGKYLFPCDEAERDRMDIYHKIFSVARDDALFSAPITINPAARIGPRIIDLGCGTGIWAIDVAEKLLVASGGKNWGEVWAMDLALIQPSAIPMNMHIAKSDIEAPWSLGEDSWDLIHMRMLNGSILSWPDMYSQVYRHLTPGTGWFEQVDIDYYPHHDGTLAENSAIMYWTRLLFEAMDEIHRPISHNPNTRAMLERQGFVDIEEKVIILPLNPWPASPAAKNIGRWYNLGLTLGLQALTLAPLMRTSKRWTKEDVDKLCEDVKREMCSMRIHVYHKMHVWTARRPGPTDAART